MKSFTFLVVVALVASSCSLVSSEKLRDACQEAYEEFQAILEMYQESVPDCVTEMEKKVDPMSIENFNQLVEFIDDAFTVMQSDEARECFEDSKEPLKGIQKQMSEGIEKLLGNMPEECINKLDEMGNTFMDDVIEIVKKITNEI